jgi:hypothetical protein
MNIILTSLFSTHEARKTTVSRIPYEGVLYGYVIGATAYNTCTLRYNTWRSGECD